MVIHNTEETVYIKVYFRALGFALCCHLIRDIPMHMKLIDRENTHVYVLNNPMSVFRTQIVIQHNKRRLVHRYSKAQFCRDSLVLYHKQLP